MMKYIRGHQVNSRVTMPGYPLNMPGNKFGSLPSKKGNKREYLFRELA